ncbi:gamma-glutamyl-gamma-aminobutyrate hydrolase [Rhodospirillum rubrum]|uniref:gamma-glutamyl-gamma-aminobutyrate hydrolase family protein n=1 Tax=Rhodospirillum rubrum TaxID=1085 RepID=UPI001904B1F7|nr:gamma-glutamyl-gamma-aminobutyrate hydrolase family protein [Rhodospirillum rubrum]MBK1666168.1 gamma-glutamyl-gamma-aminobutyrate hydrolase [Rhodospirillum rubrum]MBK1678552.1 gamma-glutamyl-gamma-aminobutyrate hydrolase [Rhodospirillum rubrum]
MTRPVIGITADSEEEGGGYSAMPWYAIRHNYCDSVAKAGGLPVILPHNAEVAADFLGLIDGLLITGGAFDVDPALFGEAHRHQTVVLKQRRTAFELAILRGALAADMPILGICGGQQLLAVALGGRLIQHIPDVIKDGLAHEQPNPRTEVGHQISVTPGSLLHRITGVEVFGVNSAHHQAVESVPAPVIVDARARDGVIEGVEDPSRRFCLGVQWHPEYAISAADTAIFDAFVAASRGGEGA